jgi:extracellular elastinolytic metalloproteinase
MLATSPEATATTPSLLTRVTTVTALSLLLCAPSFAANHRNVEPDNPRNFDARVQGELGAALQVRVEPSEAQSAAMRRVQERLPGTLVTFEQSTGAVRTLSHPTRFLTEGIRAGNPSDLALDFVRENLDLMGLGEEDLGERRLTDEVLSSVSGVSHLYWQQMVDGIPVYNGQLHVNVDPHGRVLNVNNAFVPDLRNNLNARRAEVSAARAVRDAARSIGIKVQGLPDVLSQDGDAQYTTVVDGTGISLTPITAKLVVLPVGNSGRLAWNFVIETGDEQHMFDFNVDAVTSQVWTRFDWTSDAAYRVYARPDESPNHSSGRVLANNPQNAANNASPNGWHNTGSTSYTILRGNNAHAYEDSNGSNSPPGSQPSGGSTLVFDFALNLNNAPSTYRPAAVTNLFYWNNIIHDVQYQHGFTESAGNFQVNNFGRGGSGNDDVRAEAQDGGGNCNANFSTPTDGGRPRMQMYTCSNTSPARDGDFDNGVIVHEYGHGISIRQVGGPNNSSCLNNNQQGGEGWSDWHAMVYTAKAGDTGPQKRGMGTYLFGQPANGDGIRPQPYSTSSSINNYTYASISGQSIPHGVGSVWAQALWEVYWALVDKHGFDTNLYNSGSASGAAGNTRALTYVNEGLQNTACSPTFIAARDGIIAAATSLHGGEDVCDIWEAFAAFGLGVDAFTSGSNSTSATNGFDIPTACDGGGPGPGDPPPACPAGSIDFDSFSRTSYADQNVSNTVSVADSGDTLVLQNNTWIRSTQTFSIGSSSTVDFYFKGGPQGEIHSIGFDADDNLNNAAAHYQVWGTQNWTGAGKAAVVSPQYSGSGWQSYSINVSGLGSGNKYLVFGNDNDVGSGNESRFACVRVNGGGGGPGPGGCSVDEDFESGGAANWYIDGASTCFTGDWVVGNPTQQISTVVTQPNGSADGVNSVFTAGNSSVGVDDVDGGNCIVRSPVYSVPATSTLTAATFHGQRDTGGDPSGDFYRFEYRVNGGAWQVVESNGDSRSVASWHTVSTTVPAGNVELRMQASDGLASGDIVEAGIDAITICE